MTNADSDPRRWRQLVLLSLAELFGMSLSVVRRRGAARRRGQRRARARPHLPGRVGSAIGFALARVYPPAMRMISTWFRSQRGLGIGTVVGALTTRLARYWARHPVALSRLRYAADSGTLTYRSDKATEPTAGAETVDALAFLGGW